MKVIYKYTLSPWTESYLLPKGANVISAESQRDEIVVYAIVNPDESETEIRHFKIVGTGHKLKFDQSVKFLNTVKIQDGTFMFHVFEILD